MEDRHKKSLRSPFAKDKKWLPSSGVKWHMWTVLAVKHCHDIWGLHSGATSCMQKENKDMFPSYYFYSKKERQAH
jgi:hypothetical protein